MRNYALVDPPGRPLLVFIYGLTQLKFRSSNNIKNRNLIYFSKILRL